MFWNNRTPRSVNTEQEVQRMLSWYAVEHLAHDRIEELKAAAGRPQASVSDQTSNGERAYALSVITGHLHEDLGGVLTEPRRGTADGRGVIVELPGNPGDGDRPRARVL